MSDEITKAGLVWKTDVHGRRHAALYGLAENGELGIFYLGAIRSDVVKTEATEHEALSNMAFISLEAWIAQDPYVREAEFAKTLK